MNLSEELAELSRHLMLFLVAIFAFSSQGVLDSKDTWAIRLYVASLVLAALSFLAGYATLFRLFNDELQHPSTTEKAKPTPKALRSIKAQYALTVLSLTLAMGALARILLK